MSLVAPLVRATMENARGPMHCVCQGEPAPRQSGQDDLGGVRGGASERGALCRPIRRLPCRPGLRHHVRGSARSGLNWSTGPIPRRPSPCLVRFDSEEDQQKVRGTFCPTNALLGRRPRHAAGVPLARPAVLSRVSHRVAMCSRPMANAHADRLECWQDGQGVARHDRAFGRGKTIYDALHYIPVLARKPGALRREPRGRHRPCAVCSASWNDSPAVIGRSSRSSAPCSPMASTPSKPPAPRPCLTTFIPPA